MSSLLQLPSVVLASKERTGVSPFHGSLGVKKEPLGVVVEARRMEKRGEKPPEATLLLVGTAVLEWMRGEIRERQPFIKPA